MAETAAALILAAGRSTRFSGSGPTKLVAEFCGKPLVRHVAEAALSSSARPVVVVTGHARAEVEAALAGLDVQYAHNADYGSGLSGSLKRGLAALPPEAAGAVILLADMPLVSAALIDRLALAFLQAATRTPPPLAAVPFSKGARGNPVLLGRALFPAVAALEGDRGARALIEAAGARVLRVEAAEEGALIDIDTAESLAALERSREGG